MKQISFLLLVCVLAFASCVKENAQCTRNVNTTIASGAESDSIARYLTANSLAATKDPAGFYYSIVTPGTGSTTPEVCSYVSVRYAGYTFTGAKFDGTTGSNATSFTLGDLIAGWQKGIPYLKTGGSIILYIPPSLGYGAQEVRDNNNNVLIPANSFLRFTIDLVSVQ